MAFDACGSLISFAYTPWGCEALVAICWCSFLSRPVHLSPSNDPVCRAIISSSLVGITQAETLLQGVDIRGPLPVFASASISMPSHAEASPIRRRISGEFSPMPAVKTSPSMPPRTAASPADFLCGAIDEVINRQPGFWLAAVKQLAHVITDSGNTKQARLLINDCFHILGREAEALKKIKGNAWIERTRPRTHA